MPGEREDSSEHLAAFIVGVLHGAGVVSSADLSRATGIAKEEINVCKATGDYWCSWCSLSTALASPGVQADDDSLSFVADGFELRLKRVGRVGPDGRVQLEVYARAGGFGSCHATQIRIEDLLRFASVFREGSDHPAGERVAALRSDTEDVIIELTARAGSATAAYRLQVNNNKGVVTALSGSFITDARVLETLGRELRSLVHDSWAKA